MKNEILTDEFISKTKSDLKRKSFNNHSNPISKKLISFINSKIGEKFSINDLLR